MHPRPDQPRDPEHSRLHLLRFLAQRVFLDLAGRGFRQGAEDDAARRLVVREIGAAPGDDVGSGDFAGGWFHTGDLAVRHADGYIEIKDRSKDIIISGGENISSIEVEEVLYRHPMVMEAAVVARPDPIWGETPCAFVTLKPDAAEVSAADIIAWCRASLAHFKVPKSVVFGPLPKTSTGKIQKYALRERAKEVQS